MWKGGQRELRLKVILVSYEITIVDFYSTKKNV